jgi:hypothetical protein
MLYESGASLCQRARGGRYRGVLRVIEAVLSQQQNAVENYSGWRRIVQHLAAHLEDGSR